MTIFERLQWRDDRVILGDLVFRLPRRATEKWELGEECLDFYKLKRLVDQYELFWRRHPEVTAEHLLELGIFGCGSMAFWFECLQPQKYVGIDIKERTDSDYFRRFIASRGAESRVKTYWGTSQDDAAALTRIVREDFGGRLDLVIDDASHFYAPTRASFELLFPYVRPGGYYIIEDWAWAHYRRVALSRHFVERASRLTTLISEFVAAAGTDSSVIRHIEIYQGFAVLERGGAELTPGRFKLDDHIYVRHARDEQKSLAGRIGAEGARFLRRLRRRAAAQR